MTDEQVKNLADAVREGLADIAAAIREMTAGPEQEEPEYRCINCGSPKWGPGGQAEAFRKCLDCGKIGDLINESRD